MGDYIMEATRLHNDFYNNNTSQKREIFNHYFNSFDNSKSKKPIIKNLAIKVDEKKNYKNIDKFYELWNYLDHYNFEEVVVLWNDLDPSDSFEIKQNYSLIYPTQKQFIQDIKKNLIACKIPNICIKKNKLAINNIDKYDRNIIFKRSDLEVYAQKIGKKPKFLFQKKRKIKINKNKNFISKGELKELEKRLEKIELTYENNSSIKIKLNANDNSKPYSWEELGFKSNKVKTWKLLLEILEYPNYGISFGQAYSYPDGTYKNRIKNKHYDAEWKICDELCKKLKNFIRIKYKYKIPNSYKLYKPCHLSGPGNFRLKFKIKKFNYTEPKETHKPLPVITRADLNNKNKIKLAPKRKELYKVTEEELTLKVKELRGKINLSESTELDEIEVSLISAIKVGVEKFNWTENYVEELYFNS
jgi:hypothetical protein